MPALPHGALPQLLTELPHWVVWRYEERDGKPTKVPYCVPTGQKASTTDPRTWSVYESAAAGAARYDGIGFVFSKDDDLVGVDLDDCRNPETGRLEDWAAAIVMQLDSYTEVTPSGRGIHILCRGKLPPGGRRKGKIELYEEGRYFTITGNRMEGPSPALEERSEALAAVHGRLFAAPDKPAAKSNGAVSIAPDQWAIIERVLRHAKGGALWRGDLAGYRSQSEAELALCGLIAFYAGPDEVMIDTVMRHSSLSREKWDSPRPGGTYGTMTIRKALSEKGPSDFFDWHSRGRARPAAEDPFVVSVVSVVNNAHVDSGVPEVPPEALYGLPGQVVRVLSPHTESSDSSLLLSFLIGSGCLIGREPYVYRDGARHGCNEFGCLIGRSAVSRKGTSLRRVAEVFTNTVGRVLMNGDDSNSTIFDYHDMRESNEWSRLLLPGLGSGEGLVASLVEAEKEGEPAPRRLIIEEEFSRPLKVMRREGSILSEMIRQAWDRGILASRTKGKSLRSAGGHISLLAHITERELQDELGAVSLFNGFGNRFLWIYTERSKSLPFGGGRAAIGPLVFEMRQVLEMAQTTHLVELTEDAAAMWGEGGVYEALLDRPPGLLGAITSRAEAHVTRLALTYAILDMRREIDVPHLLAALGIWDLNERACARVFGESVGDDYADVILERLREVYPQALTRTEIRDGFGRNAPAGRIPPALALLQKLGKVEGAKAESGGRPAEIWRAKVSHVNDQNDRNDKSPLSIGRSVAASLGYTTQTT